MLGAKLQSYSFISEKKLQLKKLFPFRDTGKVRKVEQRRCASVFLAWPDYEEAWIDYHELLDSSQISH